MTEFFTLTWQDADHAVPLTHHPQPFTPTNLLHGLETALRQAPADALYRHAVSGTYRALKRALETGETWTEVTYTFEKDPSEEDRAAVANSFSRLTALVTRTDRPRQRIDAAVAIAVYRQHPAEPPFDWVTLGLEVPAHIFGGIDWPEEDDHYDGDDAEMQDRKAGRAR